jgi:hypothetical protein
MHPARTSEGDERRGMAANSLNQARELSNGWQNEYNHRGHARPWSTRPRRCSRQLSRNLLRDLGQLTPNSLL